MKSIVVGDIRWILDHFEMPLPKKKRIAILIGLAFK